VSTLLGGHFGEVGSGFLGAALVVELDPDSMHADVPVEEVGRVLEVAEYGDGHVQTRQLVARHRIEAGVLHRAKRKKTLIGNSLCPCSYLVIAYSLNPLCNCISLKVPMQPRSFFSLPILHVTNRGLLYDRSEWLTHRLHIDVTL